MKDAIDRFLLLKPVNKLIDFVARILEIILIPKKKVKNENR